MKQIYQLYGNPCRMAKAPLLIALSLFTFLVSTVVSYAQLNSYARVTNINTGRTILTIANLSENTTSRFTVNDEVLIIQMQDDNVAGVLTNNANFGNLGTIANAGMYEIAYISAINGARTQVTLRSALNNRFNVTGNSRVQLVSFKKLGTPNYTTTANITAPNWNRTSGTGGVVAFQVAGTLTLRHSISANGSGFAGGANSDNTTGSCDATTYFSSTAGYGGKGEGIYATTNNNYTRARGKLLNGGGGGNYDNAGGAGGGNFSAGGNGGPGWGCTTSGGVGGMALNTYLMAGTRLFLGGGGGGGQGNDGTQSAGSAGGGIIIIKATTITTNCNNSALSITANGGTSSGTVDDGNDGAGGAGAGGTILMQVGSFNVPNSCRLQITANGGKGGDVNHADAHGGGGGGGQGAILFSNALPTNNITITTAPGAGGKNSNANNATNAASGSGTATSGIISGIGVVLPVQLLSFTGENNQNKALLRWTAGGEANARFDIQHSTDGIQFTTIGTVNGHDNDKAATYIFTHTNAAAGTNYYQLQIISTASNRILYSPIVSVNVHETFASLTAWPNPAHDHFNITVPQQYNNKSYVVTITDLSGKVMYTNTYKPQGGLIKVTPAQLLKPGLYMFILKREGLEQAGKLIIQ